MRLPVYNLSVEGHPEYFANGILVHNCSGAFNKLALHEGSGECAVFDPNSPAGMALAEEFETEGVAWR